MMVEMQLNSNCLLLLFLLLFHRAPTIFLFQANEIQLVINETEN